MPSGLVAGAEVGVVAAGEPECVRPKRPILANWLSGLSELPSDRIDSTAALAGAASSPAPPPPPGAGAPADEGGGEEGECAATMSPATLLPPPSDGAAVLPSSDSAGLPVGGGCCCGCGCCSSAACGSRRGAGARHLVNDTCRGPGHAAPRRSFLREPALPPETATVGAAVARGAAPADEVEHARRASYALRLQRGTCSRPRRRDDGEARASTAC